LRNQSSFSESFSDERRKLLNEVEKKWKVHVSKDPESESESDEDEDDPWMEAEDCITKVSVALLNEGKNYLTHLVHKVY